MYRKIIEKCKDKNIAILGFGKEGISTYQFLRKYLDKQVFTIIDKNQSVKDFEMLKNDNNLNFVLGDNYLDNLEGYDLIIKTPGISFKNLDITNIKDKITSQLQLLLEINKQNVIGVTGTKGKSTTSSLIYEIFKNNDKKAFLLGNIGNPIFDDIEKYDLDTYLIIEMSSLQLEFVNVSPHTGIILNLFEDHLDHAGSVKHYHECKLNMFKYQNEQDNLIYCSDNIALNNYVVNGNYKGIKYSVDLNKKADIYLDNENIIYDNKPIYNINQKRTLLGNHNLENIMVTLLVSNLYNLDLEKTIEAINNFKTLSHRLEFVGTYNGVSYYDDAIATIPNATINAIESLKNVDTLIFGGMDRNIDYTDLIDYLEKCDVNNLICMPTTGYKIGNILKERNANKNIFMIEFLTDAVKKAKEVTQKGKICLLSPAASSYEYYKNFEEKGNAFKQFVKED